MSGTAVDNVLQRLKKRSQRRSSGGETVARFLVTKFSWRGNYRRILEITSSSIVTRHPDSLAITNAWAFAGDPDLSNVEASGDHADGAVFVLHFRKDKKGIHSRDAKFACKERAALLTSLHTAAAAAAARGLTVSPKLLGRPEVFPAYKLRKGEWVPVTLRVTATALERLDPNSGAVKWRWLYAYAAAPAARTLFPGDAPPGNAAFALLSKTGRSPRVYAARDREAVLRSVQAAALRKVGVTAVVDASAASPMTGGELLAAVAAAERERAAAPDDGPIGEWEVLKVRDASEMLATSSVYDAQASAPATASVHSALPALGEGPKAVAPRRLVLTPTALLERRPATYEVAEWRHLGAVAALVRFADDPQWLGVEWSDGAPASIFVTPARDALLAGVLYAAQAAAGRPIPVLTGTTGGGDGLAAAKGQPPGAPAVASDSEVERIMTSQLSTAASSFLAAGGGELSLDALGLAGLTAELEESAGEGGEAATAAGAAAGAAETTRAVAAMELRIRQFNASVPYSGVSRGAHADQSIIAALLAYLPKQHHAGSQPSLGAEEARLIVAALHCLQRLSTSPHNAILMMGGGGGSGRIFSALLSRHDHVASEAARLLLRLFSPVAGRTGAAPRLADGIAGGSGSGESPMAPLGAHEDAAAARNAKSVCFISDARCGSLLAPLKLARVPSPLLSGALIEVVAAVACKPGARTTELSTREALLHEVASLGRPLFSLFNHPSRQVSDAAALVMQAVAEGGATAAAPMRAAALAEGAVLNHLLCVLGPSGPRQQLSRHLVSLWADAHDPTLRLLGRCFPPGLMRFLDEPKKKKLPPPTRRLGPPDRRSLLGAGSSGTGGHLIAPNVGGGGVGEVADIGFHRGGRDALAAAASQQLSGLSETRAAAAAAAAASLVPPAIPIASRSPSGSPATASTLGAASDSPRDSLTAAVMERQQFLRPSVKPSGLATPGGVSELLLAGGPRPSSAPQLKGNWEAFWAAVTKDHNHAALIWNERTRGELRDALQAEENALRLGRQRVADSGGASPRWNAAEFRVAYPSLASQLTIGGVHVKLLLDNTTDPTGVKALANPKEFFTAAHLHFLRRGDAGLPSLTAARVMAGGAGAAERELCVRAMAATYAAHALDVGPLDEEGIAHLIDLMDSTPSRPMRHRILELISALVCPDGVLGMASHAIEEEADAAVMVLVPAPGQRRAREVTAADVAKANAAALVRAGGVELLVDVVAAAHEASERPAAALQTGLLAAAPHAEEVKVWFYLPEAAGKLSTSSGGAAMAVFEENRLGPISKAEIRQLYARGTLKPTTPFWTPGMVDPAALQAVRELRWWVAGGVGHLTPFQAAEVALRVLTTLTLLRPASDHSGEPVLPLPAAHAKMASPRCLPHLAQAALTGEPTLVAAASALLLRVLEANAEAAAGLYRTGVYFFLLAYCGSNLLEVARLFRATHLKQAFRGAGASAAGLPLAARSFLGNLLPESLLYALEASGPEAFAAALSGDADTPEIIWTHRMRGQRLVPQMLHHIGALPRRLVQCWSGSPYEFTPCPPVGYPEIAEELWCHRYYLRHLCDEVRFPAWPVVDHVPLLQALLEGWRAELARKPLGISAAEAARALGLDPDAPEGFAEEDMKAAYRRLARQFHPDRNPQGRERFEEVQRAYEVLASGAAGGGGGPQPWRILLLLRAQCILFRRYAFILQQYKYAGFPLLLAAMEAAPEGGGEKGAPSPPAFHFLSAEVAPRLQAAAELCWLTCAASKLNGEELARSGGVSLLGRLLTRCVSIMPCDVSPTDPAALLATQLLRAFACMAAFPSARKDLEGAEQVLEDVLQATLLSRAPSATDAALQCAVQMCRSAALQTALLRRGAVGYFVPLLLRYDTTAGEAAAPPAAATDSGKSRTAAALSPTKAAAAAPQIFDPEADSARGPEFLGLGVQWSNIQAARNHHAALAVRALAALGGYPGLRPVAPVNLAAQAALSGLLTEALAPRLTEEDPRALLQDLNSSVARPQVVWNSSMREELLAAAETHRARPGADAVASAAEFSYSALKGELVVAGTFVRVFCEQPTAALKDPVALCKGLVTKVHELGPAERGEGLASPPAPKLVEENGESAVEAVRTREKHLLQALAALGHLLDSHPRLMGVLATRPALDPLLTCLGPPCEMGHFGPLWPDYVIPGDDFGAPEAAVVLPKDRWSAVLGAAADGQSAAAACDAAAAATAVLVKLTAHAGCVEAMGSERCVLSMLWLAHRTPRPADMLRALRLLHALAGTPAAAAAAAHSAGVWFLLATLLPEAAATDEAGRAVQERARVEAAAMLARVAAHPLHGPKVALWLGKVLPPGLVAAIQDGPPEAVVAALSQPSKTPELVWTRGMQAAVAEEVAHLAGTARTAQATRGSAEWTPGEGYALLYEELREELFVGGIYVRLYLKNPGHPLRHPQAFLVGLLERYCTTVAPSAADADIDVSAAVLLSAAAVAAIEHHPLLAEHGVALGYVGKLIRVLAPRVPAAPALPAAQGAEAEGTAAESVPTSPADDVSGSALRLLHALAAAPSAGENFARCAPPAVPVLVGAVRWGGAAAVLATETLKRALAPSNRSRDLLVGAALAAGLLLLLLRALDWRSASAAAADEARDEAVQRVLFVDVINLLALDGAHAAQVRAVLDSSEVWAAYKGQRHDLFLPLGAADAHGVVGLLKGPEAMRYALPAPESVGGGSGNGRSTGSAPAAPAVVLAAAPPAPVPAAMEAKPSATVEEAPVAAAAAAATASEDAPVAAAVVAEKKISQPVGEILEAARESSSAGAAVTGGGGDAEAVKQRAAPAETSGAHLPASQTIEVKAAPRAAAADPLAIKKKAGSERASSASSTSTAAAAHPLGSAGASAELQEEKAQAALSPPAVSPSKPEAPNSGSGTPPRKNAAKPSEKELSPTKAFSDPLSALMGGK